MKELIYIDTTIKPKYGETGFGAGKIIIKEFSIPDEMRQNWLNAIHRWTNFSICGCWEWEGRFHNGYGCIWAKGYPSTMWVHRISYALFNGAIEGGMHIDHKCRNPKCLNPAHLKQVTPIENYLAIHRRKRRDIREAQESNGQLRLF